MLIFYLTLEPVPDLKLKNSGDLSMGKSYLFSSELAKITGVSTDTLRYYERKGVLEKPPRSAKGYRLYPKNAVEHVKTIRSALSIGFGIKELASIFQQRKSGNTPCQEVRHLTAEKLAEVEKRITSLILFRDELRLVLQNWDNELSKTADGESAKLLEKLIDSKNAFTPENSPQNFKLKEYKKSEK